jgi:hypothetical protein
MSEVSVCTFRHDAPMFIPFILCRRAQLRPLGEMAETESERRNRVSSQPLALRSSAFHANAFIYAFGLTGTTILLTWLPTTIEGHLHSLTSTFVSYLQSFSVQSFPTFVLCNYIRLG